MTISLRKISDILINAGTLSSRPIAIFGQEDVPERALTVFQAIKEGHPCLAKALFLMSTDPHIPALFVGGEALKETCWGASAWLGFNEFPPKIEDMFSSDSPNSQSLRIKKSSELCRITLHDMGKITPPDRYIVMQPLTDTRVSVEKIRSVLCFGKAVQVRALGALVHFISARTFTPIMAPWGSGCATFVTFPSGMASNAPKDTAFLGPMTPEAEDWFPKDMMALGIPMSLVLEMAAFYDESFAASKHA